MTPGPRFLAITGPTSSGKTELSLAVAERMPVEIVSMDSRQVYIGMDVGTDKVPADARERVPHHGLDVVRPDQRYSAGHFARDARRWVREIESRRRVPLLVGGTAFFLRALMDPIFTEPELDADRLRRLRAYLAEQPTERLATWVRRLDPDRADVAVQGGPHRMGRTLEVALLSGVPLSRWHRESPPDGTGLPGVVVVLDLPRDVVDRRIAERVPRLLERGFVEEVRRLLAEGYGDAHPAMTGHGYREIAAYVRGDMTLEEAMAEIGKGTRRYARRQMTWFRNQLPDTAVRIDALSPIDSQVEAVLDVWRSAGGALAPAAEAANGVSG